jgi:poly(A) polymerase
MMLKRLRNLLRRDGKPRDAARTPDAPPVHHGPRVVHRPIPNSDLDPDAVKIVQRLTRFDHKAYLVGGCVRDLLLERQPKDFDIATSATPRQIKRVFRNSRIIGRRFRLAHIYFHDRKIIEVATFRSRNGDDDDGQQDAKPRDLLIRDDNEFGTPEEDALRRDFTINSLFYDVNDETVIDHADGLGDLRRRLVRTLGDPRIRFREDPIRILRAIKFAARLGLSIEEETLAALRGATDEIPRAAPPRVLEEINRFCRGGAAHDSFELLESTGVFPVILPELASCCDGNGPEWKLLLAMFSAMDRRTAAGAEVSTGEILAALVLPQLLRRMRDEDGSLRVLQVQEVREMTDEILRPISQRLRLARKDQEYCRQTLATLSRMAPVRRIRRSSRQSIQHRACYPTALHLLETLSGAWGDEFAKIHEHWSQFEPVAAPSRPEESQDRPRGRSRRRGRRGSGSRSRGGRDRGGEGKKVAEGKPSGDRDDKTAEKRPRSGGEGRRRAPTPRHGGRWETETFAAPPASGDEAGLVRFRGDFVIVRNLAGKSV